tara:strand:+ start:411 stop:791 length:381 start_codon:yes stop_codon:yes gene_type:complete
MAVQRITKKRIIKHDTSNPNYKKPPMPEKEVVNGNTIENNSDGVFQSDSIYGEKMENMMNKMMGKLDNLKVNGNNIYGEKNNGAIDVDVKRNIFLAKPDKANIQIDDVKKGKVNNKLDKLRALRKK